MRSILIVLALVGCTTSVPTPTGTTCPDPDPNTLTYENFGMQFMTDYCIQCHDSALPRSQRNGAPLYHDLETLFGVFVVSGHVDERAGFGPDAENAFMPPDRCPSVPGGALDRNCAQPTAEERRKLAEWIACERDRPHTF